MTITAEVNGRLFDGKEDSEGDKFFLAKLDGWESAEHEHVSLELTEGGIRTQKLKERKRELTISGTAVGSARESLARVRTKLETTFDSMRRTAALVKVNEPPGGRNTQAYFFATGRLDLSEAISDNIQRFSMLLTADDPRKYSQNLQSTTVNNATTTITNNGTASTFLLATLNSAAVVPALANNTWDNNRKLALRKPDNNNVPVGTVADFGTHEVLINGIKYDYLNYADNQFFWFPILPGDNNVQAWGSWKLEWRDAWT